MSETLLTAGQFAKLARTTKRTILWYTQHGLLQPRHVDDAGYRYYAPRQILDFQSVLLMRKLGFSIAEIASLLGSSRSMRHLFEMQRGVLEQQIGLLQRMLSNTNSYYENLGANGTLVQPILKQIPAFEMYFLARQGPYARIKDYHQELHDAFTVFPDDAVRLTAFMASNYQPVKADMKIGVKHHSGLRLKPGAGVQRETIPAHQALTCVHVGSTTLLSLLWRELAKYGQERHFTIDTSLPYADAEFYSPDSSDYVDPDDSLTTELHMPVLGSAK